jgi:hypothetical protein
MPWRPGTVPFPVIFTIGKVLKVDYDKMLSRLQTC